MVSNLDSSSEGACSSHLLPGPCTIGKPPCCQKSQASSFHSLRSVCLFPILSSRSCTFPASGINFRTLKDLVSLLFVIPDATKCTSCSSPTAATQTQQTGLHMHRGWHSTAGDRPRKGRSYVLQRVTTIWVLSSYANSTSGSLVCQMPS